MTPPIHFPHNMVYAADMGALLGVLASNLGILPTFVSMFAALAGGAYYTVLLWRIWKE